MKKQVMVCTYREVEEEKLDDLYSLYSSLFGYSNIKILEEAGKMWKEDTDKISAMKTVIKIGDNIFYKEDKEVEA